MTRKIGIPGLLVVLASALPFQFARAQDADALRGGWVADLNGIRHVYLLVLREDRVSGVYCSGDCSDPDNLAFIDDGVLEGGRLRFDVHHDPGSGELRRWSTEGRLEGERLHLSRGGAGAPAPAALVLERSPRVTIGPAPPGGFGPAPPPYQPPAPARALDPEDVLGLWLFGNGPDKQYFMFKRHRGGIRGMVCGPCFDAANMAPLENVRLEDRFLLFDIVHENSGPGILEHGPHSNIASGRVSRNEMHLWVVPSFEPEGSPPIEMTLLGPVVHQE